MGESEEGQEDGERVSEGGVGREASAEARVGVVHARLRRRDCHFEARDTTATAASFVT